MSFLKSRKNSADKRVSSEGIVDGRRSGESGNPYLNARRTWDDHTKTIAASRIMWMAVSLISLLIALTAVGGLVKVALQSKYVPYVIEVDKTGKAVAAGPLEGTTKVDSRVVKASIAEFINDARLVSPDVRLQRAAIFRIYAKLTPNDPATKKMNEWLNGSPETTPFEKARRVTVNIEIKSLIPQTPETWQVDWEETTRDRQGSVIGKPETRRALVTIYTAEPSPDTTEKQLLMNPMGIYVKDYSWQKLL